jgi:predicted O-methyltransferase YrrM
MDFIHLIPPFIRNYAKRHPLLLNTADKLLNGRESGVFIDVPILMSKDEREFLYQAARRIVSGTIVELGCYAGGSAIFLGRGAIQSGSHVYSIDPFNSDTARQLNESDGSKHLETAKPSLLEVKAAIARHGLSDTVTLIEGFSDDVAKRFPINIDLLFIDANHNHAYEDFWRWSSHIKPESAVLFHDARWPHHGRESVTKDVQRIKRETGAKSYSAPRSLALLEFPSASFINGQLALPTYGRHSTSTQGSHAERRSQEGTPRQETV